MVILSLGLRSLCLVCNFGFWSLTGFYSPRCELLISFRLSEGLEAHLDFRTQQFRRC